ncbi:hypothetical protein ACLOJK_035331 [Asimina triloba]
MGRLPELEEGIWIGTLKVAAIAKISSDATSRAGGRHADFKAAAIAYLSSDATSWSLFLLSFSLPLFLPRPLLPK